ncbi:unnamed protein product [Mycena citricolor]|uniref:DUF6534 domain-containing protein n=1 Tax=Mycena citricolor TaxID=2018698 RepID=A0AAD2HCT3_9AGAR|nr:unnamed protein product [Mycena citricolor]
MSLPAIPPGIAMITGPTMIGICLTWGFMGITLVQVYVYFTSYSHDPRGLKTLVGSLFFLDILQTAMVTADAFHWFVFGFGNMIQLNDTFLNSWDVPMLDGVISLIVQLFYCWRIYVLRKSMILPILISIVSLMQCVAGIVTAVKAHMLGQLSLISTEVVEQTMWLVGGAVADIAIAVVLCWTLLSVSNSQFRKSHNVIMRIVQLTVETNALTASVALIGLILFWAVPQHATLVVPPTAIIGKLYTNSLIAVLNNRSVGANNASAFGNKISGSAGSSGGPHYGSSVEGNTNTAVSTNMPSFKNGVHIVRTQQTDTELELSTFDQKGSVMEV